MKVFISHSSFDKPFVNKLKRDLELNYIDCWLDQDELQIGDSLLEKLSYGLARSSHFLIVLSPASVLSEWVKYELENALKYVEEDVISKIIPIHYRKCNVPKNIEQLLNLDLTNETVFLRHGMLEIYGDNYQFLLDRLIQTLKKEDHKLSENDKDALLGKNSIVTYNNHSVSFNFKIMGFKSISNFLANQIPKESLVNSDRPLGKIVPVVLPKMLEQYFSGYKFGQEIKFVKGQEEIRGHFARFSTTNNLSVTKSIRDFFDIPEVGIYKVTIDLKERTITVNTLKDK